MTPRARKSFVSIFVFDCIEKVHRNACGLKLCHLMPNVLLETLLPGFLRDFQLGSNQALKA